MPSLQGRVSRLYTDLQSVSDAAIMGRSLVGVYNTLLDLAHQERPEDAVLSRMSELSGNVDAATLRALVGQIVAAFDR